MNTKFNKYKNILIIYVNFIKETDLNVLSQDVKFHIILDGNFPESPPIVNCLTNFTFPTLFDNRNLLHSVIKQKWTKESRIDDIIEGIPYFIMRVTENYYLNILVYYGEYKLDKIYNMNEFSLNYDLSFYKCFQFSMQKNYSSKIKNERYLILTDIYFLLFDPVENKKDLGKLIFWGDIRQLYNFRTDYINEENSESLILEWNNGSEVKISFELVFKDVSIKEYMDFSFSKIESITQKYKMFHDDFWKYGEANNSFNYSNKDYLINIIKSKEKILKTNKSIFLINELITLYNKIIEIMSVHNDDRYKEFLNKLQNILDNKEIQQKMKDDIHYTNVLNYHFADVHQEQKKQSESEIFYAEINKY